MFCTAWLLRRSAGRASATVCVKAGLINGTHYKNQLRTDQRWMYDKERKKEVKILCEEVITVKEVLINSIIFKEE